MARQLHRGAKMASHGEKHGGGGGGVIGARMK